MLVSVIVPVYNVEKYLEQASKDKDFYQYGHMGYDLLLRG